MGGKCDMCPGLGVVIGMVVKQGHAGHFPNLDLTVPVALAAGVRSADDLPELRGCSA
jgi:hypothetical protein